MDRMWNANDDRLMTETPFGGHEGTYCSMPPRNVVPKPVQKPHPPVFQPFASSENSIRWCAWNNFTWSSKARAALYMPCRASISNSRADRRLQYWGSQVQARA